MTPRHDDRPDHPTSLENAVDRLEEKVADEHGPVAEEHETDENSRRGSSDEPPD